MNLKTLLVPFALAVLASTAYAQAPAGSTGECKDGSYSSAASKRGACAGHGGVKDWYSAKGAAGDAKAPASVPAPTAAAPSPNSSPKATNMPTTAAAGGGAGKVWVNTSSHVYHCQNDKWYGKTKKGEYMSEEDAKAKGNHADHKKACSAA